jgi:hypothetical protein
VAAVEVWGAGEGDDPMPWDVQGAVLAAWADAEVSGGDGLQGAEDAGPLAGRAGRAAQHVHAQCAPAQPRHELGERLEFLWAVRHPAGAPAAQGVREPVEPLLLAGQALSACGGAGSSLFGDGRGWDGRIAVAGAG